MFLFRKISFWLALAGLVFAGQLVLRLYAGLDQPVPPPPVAPPLKPSTNAIAAAGIVESRHENILIGVPVAGLVTAVPVKVWDEVEAGAPLLQLDDRELRALLGPQEAAVTVAEAVLARVRSPLSRLEALHRSGAVTDDDLEQAQREVAVAEAQLNAARAAVSQTRALLERLTVRAPAAGTILQINVRAGENVSPQTATPPLVLGDLREVQVRADVDEQLAPLVQQGCSAIGYLKGDADHPIAMDFVRIEPYVIPKRSLTGASTERVDTRVLQVIFKFPHSTGRRIYVGQQLDLYIELDKK